MSGPTRSERIDGLMAVLIMAISLTASLFAYLDSQAGNRAAVASRRAEAAAVDLMLNSVGAESEIAQNHMINGYLNDTGWISNSLGEEQTEFGSALSDAYLAATRQAERFSELVDGYLDADGRPEFARFEVETRRPAYRAAELREAHAEVAGLWGSKSAAYLAVVTILAASVFLIGITNTVARDSRAILVATGVALAAIAGLWGLAVALRPVPPVSEAAIDAYLDGAIIQSVATTADELRDAQRHLDDALEADGRYRRAYVVRGMVRQQLDLAAADGPRGSAEAVADFEAALDLDDRDAVAWSDLGAALFWLDRYPESERALRRALAIDSGSAMTNVSLAMLLAVRGDAEYERQMATVETLLAELPSWQRNGVVSSSYFVLDLAETYRPDISLAIDGFHQSLLQMERQISVGRRFFGSPTPGATAATFGPPDMSLDAAGTTLSVEFDFSGVAPGERFIYRSVVDGVEVEAISLGAPVAWPWATPSGFANLSLDYEVGFRGQTVRIELYLEGNLLALGEFSS